MSEAVIVAAARTPVREITEEIAATGFKAAFLKCAIDNNGPLQDWNVSCGQLPLLITRLAHRSPCYAPRATRGLVVKRVLCKEEGVRPSHAFLEPS
jgi:hypothetical protein